MEERRELTRGVKWREGLAGRDKIMTTVNTKIAVKIAKATRRSARQVPLMVPHGAAEAGRDFESAFEMLPRDERERELWHGSSAKKPLARAS